MRYLFCVLITCFVTSLSLGDDWTGGEGSYDDENNWSSGSVPGPGNEAVIDNGGTATIGDFVDASRLRIGTSSGTSGHVVQVDGGLTAEGAFIGENGTGSITVSGGEFLIGNESIHVGWLPNGVGEMTIDGADALVVSGDDFQLGREGTGILNLSAGRLEAGYTVIGKFGTGIWNQTGGIFDQAFGDIEIGDGGKPDQTGIAGPRIGTMNIEAGVVQTAGHLAIGNRSGSGFVNISGGVVAATGGNDSTIYVGRGADTGAGDGGETELRITGSDALVVATGNFVMNASEAAVNSTLIAEITGPTHTVIEIAGDADISNGFLKLELNGYSPQSGDSWDLIRTGLDLEAQFEAIDAAVDQAGFDPLEHGFADILGTVLGPFQSVDYSAAPLAQGLAWDVVYGDEFVTLNIIGDVVGLLGDFDNNGILDAIDIDALTDAVRTNNEDGKFDVNSDGQVNGDDRVTWVNTLRGTYFGDSNLDGEFSSADFVAVFQAKQYEDGIEDNSTWATGDWNGDGEFDSSDFVTAFVEGGYEKGPRAAAVPEPAIGTLSMLTAFVVLLSLRRRHYCGSKTVVAVLSPF